MNQIHSSVSRANVAGFQPFPFLGPPVSRGFTPGWYVTAPLALRIGA